MSTAEQHSKSETSKLHTRIEELESELKSGHSSAHGRRSETEKLRTDIVNKTTGEASRIVHALSMAFVEELRSAADVMDAVSDEAFKRREAHLATQDGVSQLRFRDVENDVAGVLNTGIEKTIAARSRVIEKFYEVYRADAAK